jgi:hypothetical protein
MHNLLLPRLYTSVVLQTPSHCVNTLAFLRSDNSIANVVKELIIQPVKFMPLVPSHNYYPSLDMALRNAEKHSASRKKLVLKMVQYLHKISPNLESLERFEWGAWDVCCIDMYRLWSSIIKK